MADNSSVTLFGFEIKKKGDKMPPSIVPPNMDDGSAIINNGSIHVAYSLDVDSNNIKNDAELINKYRELSMVPEVDMAIDEIVNEAIVYEDFQSAVKIDFSDKFSEKYSQQTQEVIEEEFENVLQMLSFNTDGHSIFRQFYIDGRAAAHKVVDEKSTKKGIKEVRWIDTTKIKKISEIKKEKTPQGVEVIKEVNEYFVYSEKGFNGDAKQGVKIAKDAIIWLTSGLIDHSTNNVLSYLHKGLRTANQLKMLEDALVIYRVTRAPERRIFYIDTGDMPRTKAEEYIKQVMSRYRNKQVYDAKTGELKDDKKHMSMLEDFWLPRANGKGTEVTTLPGGQTLGQIEDVEYFKTKLYQSLNVPITRLQAGNQFNIGRSNEISRDEIKFSKFVDKLRKRFNMLFLDLLKTQLILKGISTIDDWEEIKDHIYFNYTQDNVFSELKDSEIMTQRLQNLQLIQPYIGSFFSRKYVMKNILRLTDSEIDGMQDEIENEPTPGELAQQLGVDPTSGQPIDQSQQQAPQDNLQQGF